MAWRTAVRLGCGGGPQTLFFRPALGDPAELQEGIGHHRHQCVAMEPGPGLALEVVEAEFFLKLLMGLLANQPSFLSRHVLGSSGADPLGSSVGDAHAHNSKACAQASLRSLAPTDLTPLHVFKHGVCSARLGVWHVLNPRSPASRHREDQVHIGQADLLVPRDADGPAKAALAQCLPERSRQPITSVWQFAFLPSAVAYCGATPTDAVPVFGNAVSSMISQAPSPPTSSSG